MGGRKTDRLYEEHDVTTIFQGGPPVLIWCREVIVKVALAIACSDGMPIRHVHGLVQKVAAGQRPRLVMHREELRDSGTPLGCRHAAGDDPKYNKSVR